MAYSGKVLDHYNNPRNVGKFDPKVDSVGTGMVGAPACGDVMKLQIKVKDNIIEDVVFKTYGCGSAIASSSMVTEMIKGMTLEEAGEVRCAMREFADWNKSKWINLTNATKIVGYEWEGAHRALADTKALRAVWKFIQ